MNLLANPAEKELAASNIKASFFMIENNGDYASDCVVRTDVEAGTFIDVNEVTVNVYIAKERVVINPPEATPAPTPSPAPTPAPGTCVANSPAGGNSCRAVFIREKMGRPPARTTKSAPAQGGGGAGSEHQSLT